MVPELVLVIGDVLLAEVLGIFLPEHGVEVLAGVGQLLAARDGQGKVRQEDDAFQPGHGVLVQVLPHLVAHEEQAGLGVVDDVMHVVRLELVQDGHGHRPVGQRGQEGDAPMRTVAPAQGNLVPLADAAFLEKNVQLFYFAGHIFILQGGSLVVGQCVQVPILLDAVLDIGDKTLFHNCTLLSYVCKYRGLLQNSPRIL